MRAPVTQLSMLDQMRRLNTVFGKFDEGEELARAAAGYYESLRDIDLDVKPGEFVVFLGLSGCGKSTLLRCIAGLESPDAGQILLRGERIVESTGARRLTSSPSGRKIITWSRSVPPLNAGKALSLNRRCRSC